MKNNTVARVFTYRLKCILLVFILVNGMSEMQAAQARPQQNSFHQLPPQGLFQRLIKIKYSAELYLITAQKNQNKMKIERSELNSLDKLKKDDFESLDSALSIYNTIRWNVDGLVYQLSGDLVAANTPKKLRQLNAWCLNNEFAVKEIGTNEGNDKNVKIRINKNLQPSIEALQNIERYCKESLPAFSPIGKITADLDKTQDLDLSLIQNATTTTNYSTKNINLTTNVFYLIKDSYSLIKGLSDLKTQKSTALVEILDQMRLASPQELLKQAK